MKSCCTLSSRSRRVSSIASPPFRPRAAAATPAPRRRRWAPPPSRRLASSHRSRRAFRVPAPLRARPARAAAVQRAGQIPAAPKGRAFAGALALSAVRAGSPRAARWKLEPGLLRDNSAAQKHHGKMISVPALFREGLAFEGRKRAAGISCVAAPLCSNNVSRILVPGVGLGHHTLTFHTQHL